MQYKCTRELNVTLKTYKMSSRKGQVIKIKTFSCPWNKNLATKTCYN